MSTAANGNELLVVEDLKKHFPITRGIVFQKEIATVKAVDGVSFSLREGETLGIVGESGCGKSTLVRCILKLLEPTGGRILFQGQDITGLSRREMRPLRRNMRMVVQYPYASLNARKRVGFIIGDALELRGVDRGVGLAVDLGRDLGPGADPQDSPPLCRVSEGGFQGGERLVLVGTLSDDAHYPASDVLLRRRAVSHSRTSRFR